MLWMKLDETGQRPDCNVQFSMEAGLEILIVDDERDLLESLRRGLSCLHHKTREVTSADAALNVLQASSSIDLVITDHAMPGMNGMELVEWIHREKADLPVIIMTAFRLNPDGKPIFYHGVVKELTGLMGNIELLEMELGPAENIGN
jgi:CheY-like chemotaxis protein